MHVFAYYKLFCFVFMSNYKNISVKDGKRICVYLHQWLQVPEKKSHTGKVSVNSFPPFSSPEHLRDAPFLQYF